MIHLLKTFEPTIKDFRQELERREIDFSAKFIPLSCYYFSLIRTKKMARMMKRKLKRDPNPVVINGSGNYHHLTYGFCSLLEEPFGYIHFDRHHDFGDRAQKLIGMGGFVDHILADTKAEEALLIGSVRPHGSSSSVIPYHRLKKNLEQRIKAKLPKLPDKVYISVDLDVLFPSYFRSGYYEGKMKPSQLYSALDLICQEKEVIGGDICGYCEHDQPSLRIAMKTILKINDAVNK